MLNSQPGASTYFLRYFKYQVERFLIRGPFYQVLFIGVVIGLISVVAGQVLLWIEPEAGDMASSSWWAFLRMSDPGYLGDDNGTAKRILATVLTLLGYVLFMGSLVAIMTQWLYKLMKDLEAGYTPIMLKGHISILNYTNRTPIIIQELLYSKDRFLKFLKLHRTSKQRIVVLNQDVGYELTADLEDHIGTSNLHKVIFRTGDLMRADDLGRVNVEKSSVVIIPSNVYGDTGQSGSDTKTIKALLSIKNRAETARVIAPKVVVEILDDGNVEIAKAAYRENIEIVSGRVFLSRMLAQNIQNPNLSYVISELIAQGDGSEIYLKAIPELVGKNWHQIKKSFPESIVIGLVSETDKERCLINPNASELILKGDLLIFISSTFETIILDHSLIQDYDSFPEIQTFKEKAKQKRKLLVMGWSNKTPFLIKELLETKKYDFEVDILSLVKITEREKLLSVVLDSDKLKRVHNIEADYTSSSDLRMMDFSQYQNVVFLSSDRANDGADADARSILGVLQLRKMLEGQNQISILIELAEPENEKLLEGRHGETIISPMVISYILANIAMRSELNKVFDSLFYSQGSDITFVKSVQFEISGDMSFQQISDRVDLYQMIAIGMIKIDTNEIVLNPNSKEVFKGTDKYKIIVIN